MCIMDSTSSSEVLRRYPGFPRPFILTKPPAVRSPPFLLLAMGLHLFYVLQSRSMWRQAFHSSWLCDSRILLLSLQREVKKKRLIPWGLHNCKSFEILIPKIDVIGLFHVSIYEQNYNLFCMKFSGKENGVTYLWYLDKSKLLSWKLWN